MTEEQIAKALNSIKPCPVPGATFAWLCEFANAVAEEAVKQERERLAAQWDSCIYEGVGEEIDIGQAIRARSEKEERNGR